MKAVITVLGDDSVGILAQVAGVCASCGVNVEEVKQNILGGTFAMIMVVEIEKATVSFDELQKALTKAGTEKSVEVRITLNELYEAMHRI